jgi:LruC domain-containing protein
MLNKSSLSFVFILALTLISCQKAAEVQSNNPNPTTPVNKVAPDGFNYQTTKAVAVSISALTNTNKPIAGVPISVYSTKAAGIGQLLFKGVTNAQGQIVTRATIPSYMDTVVVDANFVGLIHNALVTVNGNSLNCILGGADGYGGNVVGTLSANESKSANIANTIIRGTNSVNGTTVTMDLNGIKTDTKFSYLGNYDGSGKPNYLTTPGDEITVDMLNTINVSLPEGYKVPNLHPEYITKDATSNIVIKEDAEVWLTFTYEGAGYRNALGFYTYDSKTPPQSLAEIAEIKFVFPNASLKNSGGSLISGDKVKIGTFKAGTTIGLVLFQDAWNGKDVSVGATALFSDPNLNPEPNVDLRKHNVMLKYNNTYIIGFEDIRRDYGSCDQDFNDLMFYATSNPITAIDTDGVKDAEKPVDTDGDGVMDIFDVYPTDPERAYINYYPSKDTWGTLAFEDMFPSSGDYDLNDLVMSYRYTMISNARNNVVEMNAEYQPLANGASYHNAFGIQFPFASNLIKSVTGQKVTSNLVKFNANGTEAGQSKAVIMPYDDVSAFLFNPGGAYFANTRMEFDKVTTPAITVFISFVTPISTGTLDIANNNPFLVSNQRRTHEVHLPGFAPTDLADLKLLGTGEDNSDPSSNRYYVTKDNHPWALNFASGFTHPVESAAINTAYLHFFDWAQSGGTSYRDWYSNTGSGYRNNSNLFTK